MPAIAYVNGRYCSLADASISIQDRGFQFGDGIYEVLYVYRGQVIDSALHMARLARSLAEIELPSPVATTALSMIICEVVRRNRVTTGLVYMQVTRGAARRDHPFPSPAARPSLVITARPKPEPPEDIALWASAAITLPDERWARCDIKSINLLPNVLARQAAQQAGAYEAILIDTEGEVTEGAASTVWAVTKDGVLRTRALDRHILPGCTRAALIATLVAHGIGFVESPIPLSALRAAREIFLTGATSFVKPVTTLDGKQVGDGKPGPIATSLFALYIQHMRQGRTA
jgi:D-alanine transaminase